MVSHDTMRLQKYLAQCGVASRRKCEEYIVDGRVTINGTIVRVLGTKVGPADKVAFDGKPVLPERRKLYIALNKPRGYLCTSEDPEGRPLALDLLSKHFTERIYSVGRLDFNSSGLILFTNDGEFAKSVSHPSSGIEKEYLVESFDPFPEEFLEEFKRGVVIEGAKYRIEDYTVTGPNTARIVLIEGKNREIRRLYESKNAGVRRIHRVRIGPLVLGDLRMGKFRSLEKREIEWFLGRGRT